MRVAAGAADGTAAAGALEGSGELGRTARFSVRALSGRTGGGAVTADTTGGGAGSGWACEAGAASGRGGGELRAAGWLVAAVGWVGAGSRFAVSQIATTTATRTSDAATEAGLPVIQRSAFAPDGAGVDVRALAASWVEMTPASSVSLSSRIVDA